MREIKFRAFEKHSQRMFYNVQSGIYMDPDEFESFNDLLGLARYKVMQFTGLKDKNGDEIYEGDILSDGGEIPFYIDFSEEKSSFCFVDKFDPCGTEYYTVKDLHYEGLEIIGNIYQNPDLLEEAQ